MSIKITGSGYTFHSKALFATGCTTAALVVAEGLIRYQFTKSLEHFQKQRKFELITNGTLLGLTLLFTAYICPMGVGAIAVLTLRRLYADFRFLNIDLQNRKWRQQSSISWSYVALEVFAGSIFGAGFFTFSTRNSMQAKCVTQFAILIEMVFYQQIREIFLKKMFDIGLFKGKTIKTALLETEGVCSLFTSFHNLAFWLVAVDFIRSMLNLQEKIFDPFRKTFWKKFIPIFYFFQFIIVSILYFFECKYYFSRIFETSFMIANFKNSIPLTSKTPFVRDMLKAICRFGILYPLLEPEEEKFFALLHQSGSSGSREIFKQLCPFLRLHEIEAVINKRQEVLTPEFLSLEPELWKRFSEDQARKFLLTAELKQLLNGNLEKFRKELDQIMVEVSQVQQQIKNLGNKPQNIYPRLKPYYEQLEFFNFVHALTIIQRLPQEIGENQIMKSLKELPSHLVPMQEEAQELRNQLEELAEDLFLEAYESLPFTEDDLADLFLSSEENSIVLLKNSLESREVKYKGDLIQKGILQEGEKPDNSTQALKNRLRSFLEISA